MRFTISQDKSCLRFSINDYSEVSEELIRKIEAYGNDIKFKGKSMSFCLYNMTPHDSEILAEITQDLNSCGYSQN